MGVKGVEEGEGSHTANRFIRYLLCISGSSFTNLGCGYTVCLITSFVCKNVENQHLPPKPVVSYTFEKSRNKTFPFLPSEFSYLVKPYECERVSRK